MPTPTPTATATSPTTTTSSGSSALPWILLAIAGAVIIGMLIADFLRRRNAAAVARIEGSRRVAKTAREMAESASAMPRGNDPAVVALWWQLLEVRQAALAEALAVRADVAADDPLAAPLADVDAGRSALNQGIATDRTLRIGPPPPSEDQLSYSAAVIRERATRLRDSAAALERVLEPVSRG